MQSRVSCCAFVTILWGSLCWSAEVPSDVPSPPEPPAKLPAIPASAADGICRFLSSEAFASGIEGNSPPAVPRLMPVSTDSPVSRASSDLTPLQHLRKAADHLEAAGEWNGRNLGNQTAAEIRRTADALEREAAQRLEELTRHVEMMQEEIARLRRLTGTPDQIRISCIIAEVPADRAPKLLQQITENEAAPEQADSQAVFWVSDARDVVSILTLLARDGDAKILARPSVVTQSGRPATVRSGGEFPILIPQDDGKTSVEWREFGVRFEAVPHALGNGRIRLEVAPELAERDFANAVTVGGMRVPAVTTRRMNTKVEMQLGQTLILGGMTQQSKNGPQTGSRMSRSAPQHDDQVQLASAETTADETETTAENNETVLWFLVTAEANGDTAER